MKAWVIWKQHLGLVGWAILMRACARIGNPNPLRRPSILFDHHSLLSNRSHSNTRHSGILIPFTFSSQGKHAMLCGVFEGTSRPAKGKRILHMFFMGVCRLLGRVVGSLWNVSVCFCWVCLGCLGDWPVACGMCRYVFYW